MSSDAPVRSARRRGGAGGSARQKGGVVQAGWRVPHNPWPPFEIVSADQIEAIHQASLRILSEIGMKVLDDETRALFVGAGATVLGDITIGRGAKVAAGSLVLRALALDPLALRQSNGKRIRGTPIEPE